MPATQSKLLTRKLRSLGRTLVLTELSRRMAIAISAAILLLVALVLTDALLELSLDTRKVLLTIATAITGILFLRTLITPITQHRNDEELALMSEAQHPDFDSRLIAAVQFSKGKATNTSDNVVVQGMLADTEAIAKRTNLLTAVDPRFLARALLAFVIISTIAAAAFFTFQKLTPTLVKRAFLHDIAIPRDTQILTTSGDQKIGIGDLLELNASATGVLPEEATLRVRFASGRKLDYPLTKTESAYAVQIEDVPESFTYQFRINDARSAEFKVEAFARPEIEAINATQTYPAYTGIEPSQHQPGDFYLFPGSRFKLQLTATKPLAEANLRLIGLETVLLIDVATNSVEFEVPTEGLTGFSITMRDTDGMDAREPAVYRAELLGDEPPRVRITYPTRSNELVTKKARSLIAFEATDRFGIASVHLNFRINDDPDVRSQELEFAQEETGAAPTTLKHQYEWDLSKIEPPLKESDVLEYWISAQDRQKVSPGIGESEHLSLRIVSVSEKRKDLLSRASDYLGGVGATTEDQQRLNTDLGELIRAKD